MDCAGDKNQTMNADPNLEQIGDNFVCDYYSTQRKFPNNLSKYYDKNSIFVLCESATKIQSFFGQKEIHDCIAQQVYKEHNINIISVNTQNLWNYIVISVIGELTKNDDTNKKISQTIVLDHNGDEEYVIKNNIVYYSDTMTQNNNRKKFEIFTREWRNKNHSSLYHFDESIYLPTSHQLFVSGIPSNTTSQDLKQFFEQYGKLYSLRIMKKNLNYGFITYDNPESPQKVLENRPIIFPNNTGVWLVVKEKKNNMKHEENMTYFPTSHQLFIGDIPDNVTSDDLKDFFHVWGKVVTSRVIAANKTSPEPTSKNVNAFVTFETEQSAKAVLKNAQIMFPNENGVRLNVMEKCYKPSGNKNIQHEEFKKNKDDDKTIFI